MKWMTFFRFDLFKQKNGKKTARKNAQSKKGDYGKVICVDFAARSASEPVQGEQVQMDEVKRNV